MCRFTALAAALVLAVSIGSAQPQGKFERTFNVSGFVSLELETDSGGIFVVPGPPGQVQIRATLKGSMGWLTPTDLEPRIRRLEQNPPVEQTGNTVRVGRLTDRALLRGISMRLDVTAPPESKLRARADSGGIRVEGIKGPVDLKTDSGGIEASRIGSDVHAEADSGGIRIRGAAGAVYVRVDSGGVEVSDAAGSVDAQTDSGGVRISQIKPAPIRAHADSGGVRVQLAANGGYDIDAAGDSGRVTVPALSSESTRSRNRAVGKVRGGGPLVNVKAGSGPVTVE